MGLLTTYSKANRVVNTDTVVSYSIAYIEGQWVSSSGTVRNHAYEARRFRSKQYKYVGMNYDTAKQCAAAAVTYYTRPTKYSEWQGSGWNAGSFIEKDGGTVLMADITISHTGGGMWEVSISVNEEDARLDKTRAANVASLFTFENLRQYDEGETAFAS